ncbi:MAG: hypothetical protein ACTSX8_08470 [Alphaproteobacteria bacterium]
MAAETTTTTLTELVAAEVVELSIKDYLIDAPVINPLCEFASIAGLGSKVKSFARWVKDAGGDITEATAMSNTALETLEVSVTVAQVGILREIMDFAAETVNIGPQGLFQAILDDGVALVVEMLEDDLAALFASADTTVGTTTVDMTIANFVEGIAKMRTAKARGQYVAVLDDQQAFDLTAAIAASTGAVWGGGNVDQSILNARSDGFVGSLMEVPIYMTNLTDTANGAADVVGIMMVDAASNKSNAAISWVQLWAPRVRQTVQPSMPSVIVSTTFAYGVAMTHTAAAVQFVTDA